VKPAVDVVARDRVEDDEARVASSEDELECEDCRALQA